MSTNTIKDQLSPPDSVKEIRVMFIDDDHPTLVFHRLMAKKAGVPDTLITTFDDANDALIALNSDDTKTHIIFADINMPAMSGIEFATKVEAELSGNKLPDIYLVSSDIRTSQHHNFDQLAVIKGTQEKLLQSDILEEIFNQYLSA